MKYVYLNLTGETQNFVEANLNSTQVREQIPYGANAIRYDLENNDYLIIKIHREHMRVVVGIKGLAELILIPTGEARVAYVKWILFDA